MIPGPPGPAKITLDQESFKALASDVRVGILKVLDDRRQTVTDLSTIMNLSKPTLLEHLEKLQAAGLVKRVDEGRKWIYYELSDKGKKILHPERVSIVVALSTAIGLAALGVVYMISLTFGTLGGAPVGGVPQPQRDSALAEAFAQAAAATGPWLGILMFALAGVAIGAVFLLRRWGDRRRAQFFAQLPVP